MKRALCLVALMCLSIPLAFAQSSEERGEFGVYADYFRLAPSTTNFYGVGGRIGFNVHSKFQLEGETAYDFEQSFSSSIPCTNDSSCTPTLVRGSTHVWDGLFGPKIQTSGPVKFFVFAKGGFLNFAGGNPSFVNQVGTFGGPSTYGAFYPGGGIEAYIHKVGIRLDVGDLMYFNNGAKNNLKVSVGPSFRF